MALSDSDLGASYKATKRRAISNVNHRWSDAQKLETIKLYLLTGNLVTTAASLKIPEETVRTWKQSQWWKDLEAELRLQTDLQLTVSLQKIVDKSVALMGDRLENGDFIYDSKRGKLVRKPVPLKEVHRVAMDSIDKKRQIEQEATRAPSQEAAVDRFIKLAEKFTELANRTLEKPTIEVTDVILGRDIPKEESKDALHSE